MYYRRRVYAAEREKTTVNEDGKTVVPANGLTFPSPTRFHAVRIRTLTP